MAFIIDIYGAGLVLGVGGDVGGMSGDQETLRRFFDFRGVVE